MIAGAAAVLALAAGTAATRVRRFEVAGASMLPALQPGDRVLLVRTRRVRDGDVVVVPDPRASGRLVVKRVVDRSAASVTVRGDNPHASTDSRTFGAVPAAAVWGRVFYRYFPSSRRGSVGRLVP